MLGMVSPFQNTSKFLISAIKIQFWIFTIWLYLCMTPLLEALCDLLLETEVVNGATTVQESFHFSKDRRQIFCRPYSSLRVVETQPMEKGGAGLIQIFE